MLPSGEMHLVFRLDGPALRVFRTPDDLVGTTSREPVLGGARSAFYVKEVGASVLSIGAQLRPGAAQALFGLSAGELAGVHTPLSLLWGGAGASALDRIASAPTPEAQLSELDAMLCARLRTSWALHPQVVHALNSFEQGVRIDALVERSDYSHRTFNVLFKEATGLGAKRYARLLRFQQLLRNIRNMPAASLSELAFAAGYSDQAHMNREFREFAGMTPLQYRLREPVSANHVIVPLATGKE